MSVVEGTRNKKIKFFLFILLFFTYSYFYHGGGHNSNTRINLTRAIVEEGRFMTDSFSLNTADLAINNGHTYCDKAPGTSFLGVIPFFFITQLEKILPEKFVYIWGDRLRNHITIAFSVSLISAISALFLFELLGFYSTNLILRLFVTIGYSLGTPAFAYSTLFYGHQVAASFLIIILFMIHKIILGETSYEREWLYLFISGLLSGLTVLSEYPTAPVIVFLTIFIFIKLIDKKKIIYFIAGGLIIAAFMFSYNTICFDNPISVGYSTYGSKENPSWAQMKKGVMGIELPRIDVIYKLLFGTYRGLFYLAPFLLLSIPGFYFFFKIKEKRHFFYLSILITVFYLCLNSGYGNSQIFWGGGYAMGPRHLVPMIPFLMVPILLSLKRIKFLGVFLILISILISFMAVAVAPRAPYEYSNPLIQYYITNFFRGELSKNIVTTFPPKFSSREFVAYNLGEIFGLKRIKSIMPLLFFWIAILIPLINHSRQYTDKLKILSWIKILSIILFFIIGIIYLHNLHGITDISKVQGESGLFGKYYSNTNWLGEPSFTRVDKRIDFIWDLNTGRPFPGSFSVEWEGYILIVESGDYTFGINSDDGSLLYIDNKLLVDNGGMHGSQYVSRPINLTKGYHQLKLIFQDFGGGAVMELYWEIPGQTKEIIDSKYLIVSTSDQNKD